VKRWFSDIVALLIVAGVVAMVGVQYGRRTAARIKVTQREIPTGPLVSTDVVRSGSIPFDVVAYGQVVPTPNAVHVYSIPLEARVVAIAITPGQHIAKGDTLFRVEPSPDTTLVLAQSREDLTYATKAYELANQRLAMRLATESEAAQARNVMALAQSKLDNLMQRSLSKPSDIVSDEEGIISLSPWSPGSIVPAGAPIVEVAPIGAMQVMLQVETEDVALITAGERVTLAAVDRGERIDSHGVIRTITHQIDPATRLVNVAVDLKDDGLLLNQYVEGRITITPRTGLIVPRSALVARPASTAVFTVVDGVAHEHVVQLIVESLSQAIIEADTVRKGMVVVIGGAAGLSDGIKVEVAP